MGVSIFNELQQVGKIFKWKAGTLKTITVIILVGILLYFIIPPVIKVKKNIDSIAEGQKQVRGEIVDLKKTILQKEIVQNKMFENKLDCMYEDFIFITKHQSEMSKNSIIDYLEKSKERDSRLFKKNQSDTLIHHITNFDSVSNVLVLKAK